LYIFHKIYYFPISRLTFPRFGHIMVLTCPGILKGAAMLDVFDAVNFILRAAGDNHDVTNLKLNKLLYFAQGHFLARYGKPLFNEPFEAWQYGPVIRKVYDRYKCCGNTAITLCDDPDAPIDTSCFDLLVDVMREYNKYTASYLVNVSHMDGTPWANTPQGGVIALDAIRDFFISYVPHLETFDDILDAFPESACVSAADGYDPDEDAIWETAAGGTFD
jgi:uncharacterized phage-associated protein